eukprot:421524_1
MNHIQRDLDLDLATTLLQRIQFLSAKYLPPKLCAQICSIEKVMNDAALFTPKNNSDHLNIAVKRNFAISELTEDASLQLTEDNAGNNNGNDSDNDSDRSFINDDTICFQHIYVMAL